MGLTREEKTARQFKKNNYRELPQPACCYNCKNAIQDYDGDLCCELVKANNCVSPFGCCDKYEADKAVDELMKLFETGDFEQIVGRYGG